jgi:hypothetical protein
MNYVGPGLQNPSSLPKTTGSMSPLAIAAAAAPVVGSIFGNIGRKKREREAREYNSPMAQMARLQEAGLNPNLIYGSSPSGAAGTGQAPDYEMKVGSQDILNSQTLRQITAQTQNIQAQTRLADMNAAAVAERMPALQAESENAARKILSGIEQTEAQTGLIAAQTRSALVDANIKTETQQQQIKRLINDSELSNENLKGKQLQNAYDNMRNDLMKLGISPNDRVWIKALGMLLPSLKDRLPSIFDLIKN